MSTSDDALRFVALGGGSEVGRSCHIISYKGKTVMLDAGVHPAYSGMASLPFYDEYDLSKIDVLLITHFHLDHAASLPYVMQHTNFRGRVFMTHPTKAIYRWLLSDFVRVSSSPMDDNTDLYDDDDLNASFDRIEAIDFYSTIDVEGIKFTAYHAGHVLGAAMYFVEISGVKFLFTGDYSREEDRHLHVAELPPEQPDILICESTYGTGLHQPRPEKEERLTTLIHTTLQKGGRCLLPVFALGRAQELLLILDEYWDAHPSLSHITIYYASSLARKCMAVYQTFINSMNNHVKRRFQETKVNPFHFKHVKSVRSLDRFNDVGPCVMLASPGMLQNGISRQLLERWAPDPRNALIITGYSVEGTMAKQVLNEPADIPMLSNPEVRIPRRMSVEELSFAAHVDFRENCEFIDLVGAPNIILVHGETTNMGRLKSALLSKYSSRKGTEREVKVFNPHNCVEVVLPFKQPVVARTLGELAAAPPKPDQAVSGVLVQKDFDTSLVTIADIREHTGLSSSTLMERQILIIDAGPELVRYHLEQMFGPATIESPTSFTVEQIKVCNEGNRYTVEWKASPLRDALADALLTVMLGVDSSPASVKLSSKPCDHGHEHDQSAGGLGGDRVQQICTMLRPHFGDALAVAHDRKSASVVIDDMSATIHFPDLRVESTNAAFKQRLDHLVNLCATITAPLV